ncbi:MAG TPA: SRPBCC family protein [Cyclobacteriaceae bacterium]
MTILIIVLIIIAIPLIIAATLSKDYVIEREITVDKPIKEVFEYVKLIRNSENWSKWVMTDPNSKKTYKGTDGTVGFVYGWDSENKNVGQGQQEITAIKEGERVDFELRFIKPFENKSNAAITTEHIGGNQTKVKWYFMGERGYIMKLMHFVLRLEKMLGKDMVISLNTLKSALEKA